MTRIHCRLVRRPWKVAGLRRAAATTSRLGSNVTRMRTFGQDHHAEGIHAEQISDERSRGGWQSLSRGTPSSKRLDGKFATLHSEAGRDTSLGRAVDRRSGTHGKTKTKSRRVALAHAAPIERLSGGSRNFESSYRLGGGRDFVIEGDEYDSAFFDKTAKFLKYLPDIAVVNNIEFDHADIYPDLAAIRLAFQRFVNLIPRRGLLLLGADNAEAAALAQRAHCRVETFGVSNGADWQAHDLRIEGTSTSFSVRRRGEPIGSFELPLLGTFNVRDALAALGVGAAVGLNTDTMRAALKGFKGVRRRMQLRGTVAGVSVYDDFAHHPTAIAETWPASALRSRRRVLGDLRAALCHSCRRIFQDDFARALSAANTVVLPAVFRSSLPEHERLSAEQLIADLKAANVDARYIPQVDDIVAAVARESRDGDLVVIMSNGGFENIHQKLLTALSARAHR